MAVHGDTSLIYLGVYLVTTVSAAVYFVTKLESSTENNKTFFISEISHLKEFFDQKIINVKEDIAKLEKSQIKQEEIRDRQIVQEQIIKSLHKRMDEHVAKES